jgi:hypothetical protein
MTPTLSEKLLLAAKRPEEGSQMCNVWKAARQPFPALKTRPDSFGALLQSAKFAPTVPQTLHIWLLSCRAFGA